jgi:sterol desaturase/sphingolipid hydroxylase (fatty acid hydroxylase superfamily)
MDPKTIALVRLIALGIGVVGLIAALIEALALRFVAGRPYDWRAALISVGIFVGYVLSGLTPTAIALPGGDWLYEHRLLHPETLGVWGFVLLFFGVEFLYYWLHRLGHRVRWFWITHSVHHTSNDLNISTSYRIGWTGRIMSIYIVLAPMVWLGFLPRAVFAAYALLLGYQFWVHADWIPKLGFVEGILNTPSAHRVHHGGNIEYLDANYGGVVMIFDRIFGTYRPEIDGVPVRYGLAKPLHTYNPFRIVFSQVAPMVRDIFHARSPHELIRYVFGPPGWRPDGESATTEDLRRQANFTDPVRQTQ